MVKGNNEITVNRTFKSRIFTMLYRDKKELLDLYNAVTGKHYENPEELENQHLGKCHLYVYAK